MEENKDTILPTHLQKKDAPKLITLSKVMFFASLSFCTLIATSLLLRNLSGNSDYLLPTDPKMEEGFMRQYLLLYPNAKF